MLNLAKANIFKNKGQFISLLVIIFICSMLMNLGIVILFDYTKSFDDKAVELNAPHSVFVAQNQGNVTDDFTKELLSDSRTMEAESREILIAQGKFDYMEGEQTRLAVFMNKDDEAIMGKASIVEESEAALANSIYLPYLFKAGSGYNIGDTYKITIQSMDVPKQVLTFNIAGFYEDIFYSTTNSNTTGFILNNSEFNRIEKMFDGKILGTMYTAKLSNGDECEVFTSEYSNKLKQGLPEGVLVDAINYDLIKNVRTVTSSIGSMIIVGFSLIILCVSLIVIKFRIGNSIEEDMQNIGALKSIGYTSSQIIISFIIQFGISSLTGAIIGIVCSYFILPVFGYLFAIQTGILWTPVFSALSVFAVLLIVGISVSLVSLICSQRIKKLTPIVALRFGVHTHNFKRNYIQIEKSNGPIAVVLAGKQFCQGIKQNLFISLIVAMITFTVIFGGVMHYNIINTHHFLGVIGGETSNAALNLTENNSPEDLLNDLMQNKKVEKAFLYSYDMIMLNDSYEIKLGISNDFDKTDNNNWLYEGGFPKYDNEICLGGLVAKKLGKKIGDTVTLSAEGKNQDYILTGFVQSADYMGNDGLVTVDGYRRIYENFQNSTVNVYLKDNQNTEDFLNEIESKLPDGVTYQNVDALMISAARTYQAIITAIATAIFIVSSIIVFMILYLIIKTVIIRKKKEFAIQKAIGFSSIQLALQTSLVYFPTVGIGAFIGCILGYFFINSFIGLLFTGIGLLKPAFYVSIPMLIGIFVIITVMSFLMSLWIAMRIRRVTPYELLSE